MGNEACEIGKKVIRELKGKVPSNEMARMEENIKELCDPKGDWPDAIENLKATDHYDEFIHSYSKTTKEPLNNVKNMFEDIHKVTRKRDRRDLKKIFPLP